MPIKKSKAIPELNTYDSFVDSTYGIYAYITKKGEVLYIGKDSSINKNLRHTQHIAPSKWGEQSINKVLQAEDQDYIQYAILALCPNEEDMSNLEVLYIMFYKAMGQCRYNNGIDMNADQLITIGDNIKALSNTMISI